MTTHTKHQTAQFVEIERSRILNAPYNPRSISPTNRRRLLKSVKSHGLIDALVWNVRTGHLIGGHQRVSILDELEGGKDYSLTVQQVDFSDEQEMQANLALNNKSAQGQFAHDLLKDIMAHMIDNKIDLEPAGYSTTDVQTMYPDIAFAEAIADQQEAEADMTAQISNMATVGADYEQEFRDQMGLPDTKAMEQEAQRQSAQHEPTSEHEPESSEPVPEHVERGWQEPKEYFQGKRDGVLKANEVKSQTDVMITLAFSTEAQMFAFMDAKGLDKTKRYFSGPVLEEAFEVQLP